MAKKAGRAREYGQIRATKELARRLKIRAAEEGVSIIALLDKYLLPILDRRSPAR